MIEQKNKKITIITVVFNAILYLEETIKSILSQDYNNIEYIIIDGESKDGTVNIIRKYEKYISYWISESDNGIYDAMNKGIDIATGEWINFMNAGDTFYSNDTISTVINNLQSNTDLISGNIYYFDDKNEKKYLRQEEINYPMQNMFCYHQSLFTKTSIMKDIKFSTEFKVSGDYDFVLKCYMKNYKFQYLDIPIANFRAGGMAESQNIIARIEDMFIQSKYLENSSDIFNSHSFARFTSYTKTNNSSLTKFLNELFLQCKEYNLDNKKFVLYGFGNVGEIIYTKYKNNIIYIVDQNYKKINKKNVKDLLTLKNIDFEYILITVLGKEKEIENYLIKEFNIPKHKILKFKI